MIQLFQYVNKNLQEQAESMYFWKKDTQNENCLLKRMPESNQTDMFVHKKDLRKGSKAKQLKSSDLWTINNIESNNKPEEINDFKSLKIRKNRNQSFNKQANVTQSILYNINNRSKIDQDFDDEFPYAKHHKIVIDGGERNKKSVCHKPNSKLTQDLVSMVHQNTEQMNRVRWKSFMKARRLHSQKCDNNDYKMSNLTETPHQGTKLNQIYFNTKYVFANLWYFRLDKHDETETWDVDDCANQLDLKSNKTENQISK